MQQIVPSMLRSQKFLAQPLSQIPPKSGGGTIHPGASILVSRLRRSALATENDTPDPPLVVRASDVWSTGPELNSHRGTEGLLFGRVTVCRRVNHIGVLPVNDVNAAFLSLHFSKRVSK